MDTLWVILLVVAILIVAGAFALRRRGGTDRGAADIEGAGMETGAAPETIAAEPAKPEAPGPVERKEPVEEPETAARESTSPPVVETPEGARKEVEEPPKEAEEVPEEARPGPVELKERVEELLSDSERMLGELRELGDDEGEAESVEIMAEGLTEVRALSEEEKWAQAKDKAEALRAQLSMMLQSARRGEPS